MSLDPTDWDETRALGREMVGDILTWLETIADLEIDMIAPQHGPVYRGAAVREFLDWLSDLQCGIDLMHSGGRFSE